jgi:rhamnogalacturonyl hydrolase YesR
MVDSIVRRILDRGWQEPINTGGKHSAMLNAMYLGGFADEFQKRIDEVLASPVITHPNLSDSFSRVRPLVLAGRKEEARRAFARYLEERVEAGGVAQHTTARSTDGWVFADTAYMVPPSLAMMGDSRRAVADLTGIHRILANEAGLLRHVFNAGIPAEDSYVDLDLWIDGTAWGRAQGWWLAGAVDALEVLPDADATLLAQLRRTAAAVIACQDGGLWRCTADDPYSGVDTSATVMIAYGLAKGEQLGLLGDEAKESAWQALEAVLKTHLDWRTGSLRHQQLGPMIVNLPTANPRHFHEANPYGQGFLAALYALLVGGVEVRKLGVRAIG